MKKQFLLKTMMLLCMLMVGMGAWAEEQTATLTFTAACGGSGTDDKGNSWTVTSDASESNYDATKGIHYGTSKAAVSYLTLANSSITGTITKIVVNASGASGTSAKIDVKVGGSAFGSQQSLTSSNAAYTFNGSASGNIEISLTQTSATKALYVKSVAVTYSIAADTRTAVNMTGFSATSTTLVKGDNTTTTVTNDQNTWTPSYTYESSNTNVATVSNTGVITAVAKGAARITASLDIANDDANWKKGATASKTIDITVNNPSHTAHFSVNGTIDPAKDASVEEGSAITFPTNPEVDDVVFKGWATAAIVGTQDDAPSFVNTATETMGTNDVTYYAVFATEEEGGTQWKKVAASAVNSAGIYAIITTDGHAFNGTISSGHGQLTSTAFSFDANGVATSAPDGTCEITFTAVTGGYTMYNASNGYLYASAASSGKLAWHNTESSYWLYKSSNWLYNSNSAYLRDYQNSSIRTYGANNGSVIQFAKKESSTTYSGYCTSVAALSGIAVTTAPNKVLYKVGETYDATGLVVTATYANGTNRDVTASCTNNAESPLTAGHKTITYTYNGETCTQEIDVVALDHITVTTAPDKTEYTEDEDFDATGMVVTATWGTEVGKIIEEEVTTYTLEGDKTLTPSSESVTIRYTHEGTTKTTTQSITVNAIPTYTLHITQPDAGVLTVKNGENTLSDGAVIRVGTNLTCEVTDIPEGKRFSRFYFNYGDNQNKYKATNPATFDELPTEGYTEATITVIYQNLAQYTINWHINGSIAKTENLYEGSEVSAPSEIADIYGKTFCGWVTTESVSPSDKPSYVYPTTATDNADYYAVFATLTPGDYENVTDELTRATTGVENGATSYSSWSNKTATSDAVYAGASAGSNDAIQLRSSSNSGIVTTTSGGSAKSVTVAWNSNTTNGRTLDVYGSNTAYTSIDDLFDEKTAGTKIGSIVYGTSTELTINDDYKYIGLRSNNGAMYLTSISIEWESGSPDTYSDYTTTPATQAITTNENSVGSYVAVEALDFTDVEGLEAFVATAVTTNTITLAKVNKVPAGTAFVVKGAENTYNVPFTTATEILDKDDNVTTNIFLASDGTYTVEEGDFVYALAKTGSFKQVAEGVTIPKGKAYIKSDVELSKALSLDFDDEVSSINGIENVNYENNAAYNLAGQRVNANAKGIIIVNGKKVLNK